MRRYWNLIVVFCLFCAVIGFGIDRYMLRKSQEELHKTKIYFPFNCENVVNVEVYHHKDDSLVEKKLVTETEDMIYLYDFFQSILMEDWSGKEPEDNIGVTSFRFNLSDGNDFEIVYTGYGVKQGKLTLIENELDYFVKADIAQLYFNEDYAVSLADKSELPQ